MLILLNGVAKKSENLRIVPRGKGVVCDCTHSDAKHILELVLELCNLFLQELNFLLMPLFVNRAPLAFGALGSIKTRAVLGELPFHTFIFLFELLDALLHLSLPLLGE